VVDLVAGNDRCVGLLEAPHNLLVLSDPAPEMKMRENPDGS
jgi:hypothetical protein